MGAERFVVALLAAGSSSRMGVTRMALESKLLLPLGGRRVLNWSFSAFDNHPEISKILITARPTETKLFAEALGQSKKEYAFVPGGATRQQSVLNVLQTLVVNDFDPQRTYVLVHDAARCFISTNLITQCLAAVRKQQAVTVAIPAVDSVKEVDESGQVVRSLDRSRLWQVQTPQAFRLDLLLRAHAEGGSGATDDAALVEKIYPVFVVKGEQRNFKLTTPEDYQLAQGLAQQ